MNLKKLIRDLPIEIYKGNRNIEIGDLSFDSRKVKPGDLFIAQKGVKGDGANFIQEAVQIGAVAILTKYPDPFLEGATQLITSDVKEIARILAFRFYHDPSKHLFTIGITGTNGKTTINYLVAHLFQEIGIKTGLLGTVEYSIGDSCFDAELTTPELLTTLKYMAMMVKARCLAATMEVSSIGLDLGRTQGIDFDVGVFTNLTQDHLDYHKTMTAYATAKEKLFASLKPSAWAVICKDSPYAPQMIKATEASVLTYGLDPEADLYADVIRLTSTHSEFSVCHNHETVPCTLPLLGRFNVNNSLAAIGVLLTKGYALSQIVPLLAAFKGVPGRLERVGGNVIVDHAHTPDALQTVLKTLKELDHEKLFLVFGCGGDRDRTKRWQMGLIGEKFADHVILTSDNPRSEDPFKICQEIAAKMHDPIIEIDRYKAIEKAIESSSPKDLILIAGKGHESYQVFSHQTVPFDDREIAAKIMEKHSC
ncbi:MAG: UDP-N-acetylmuramoyl-L-alanyl-D-glutamate--2,6-diaminopimelate ligase [Chlamydiia bacterium]|nr:UDP-N-acetylmuramoyl-L-alanyl-D-glutamate--2,6-diaminopimelate ligase [Chlamydiia bacterium]